MENCVLSENLANVYMCGNMVLKKINIYFYKISYQLQYLGGREC